MHFWKPFFALYFVAVTGALAQSTDGIYNLVKRRLPDHADSFQFSLVDSSDDGGSVDPENGKYVVSTDEDGMVLVEGNSLTALSTGLYHYLKDVVHVDIYWFIGNRFDQAPSTLPKLSEPLKGSSTVPWRYHFNTVTFSYTTAFWTWEDWEFQLDWLALHGVNLPLAWVGHEKLLAEVFLELGFTDGEIATFLSGPAFQAWNRMGNIQGSWGGEDLPQSWMDEQFELQKKIIKRMLDLGMTPVLPGFSGFVPRAITRIFPDAKVLNSSQWAAFPIEYSNVTFLEPLDPIFVDIQKSLISKQIDAYGTITNMYAIDQYNEMSPPSGEYDYLRNITRATMDSLKAGNPAAIWLLQGWLFFHQSEVEIGFWTKERVEAYLSGVDNNDMLILDLFAESKPQWQRLDSFFGKSWIWCQVHGFGGNNGLYGQIMNITENPVEAVENSPSLVGFGSTMESHEGNEIIYTLLLNQAWSKTAIDTRQYFHDWVTNRYSSRETKSIPKSLYQSWELLRTIAYDNRNLTDFAMTMVPKSTVYYAPSINIVPKLHYEPSAIIPAWKETIKAAIEEPSLWKHPSYQHDLLDVTRQVLEDEFRIVWENIVSVYKSSSDNTSEIDTLGKRLIDILSSLDDLLLTNKNFRLTSWISAAREWANGNESLADFYEYNARNQITLWGPDGQISGYAAKSWGGLVSSYYIPRWTMFVEYLKSTPLDEYDDTKLADTVREFELEWQLEKWQGDSEADTGSDRLPSILGQLKEEWPSVFDEE